MPLIEQWELCCCKLGREGSSFHSKKLLPAEENYMVWEKELLAIKDDFGVWQHFLEEAEHTAEECTQIIGT